MKKPKILSEDKQRGHMILQIPLSDYSDLVDYIESTEATKETKDMFPDLLKEAKETENL